MSRIQTDWAHFRDDVGRDSAVSMQGPRCKTCKLLNELPGEGAEALQKALSDNVTSTSIRRALLARIEAHLVPSAYSLARHRRGDCRKV